MSETKGDENVKDQAEAATVSRRRLLAGLVSVVAGAAVLGVEPVAAKRRPAKAKRPKAVKPAKKALGKTPVAICHFDEETGLYAYQVVPEPALKAHRKHGDVVAGVTSAEDCAALNPLPEPAPEPELAPEPVV